MVRASASAYPARCCRRRTSTPGPAPARVRPRRARHGGGTTRSWQDRDLRRLRNGDRNRLRGEAAAELKRRGNLPLTPEIAPIGTHQIAACASAGSADLRRALRCRLAPVYLGAVAGGNAHRLPRPLALVGSGPVGHDPANGHRVGALAGRGDRGVGPVFPDLEAGANPWQEIAEQALYLCRRGIPRGHQTPGPPAALEVAPELTTARAVHHRGRNRCGAVTLHRVEHGADHLTARAVGQAHGEIAGGRETDHLLSRAGAGGVDLLVQRLVDPVLGCERRKVAGPGGPAEQWSGSEWEQDGEGRGGRHRGLSVGPGWKVNRPSPFRHTMNRPGPLDRSRRPVPVEP